MATSQTYTVPAVPAATGTTKAEIAAEARMYLDEWTEGRLVDQPTSKFGLYSAIDKAYTEYAKATRCFTSGKLTYAATADTAKYLYTTFDSSGRLYTIEHAGFNSARILVKTRDWLDSRYPDWRYDASGTPLVLIPEGEIAFTLWPTPSSTDNIDIWGYYTPDFSTFTEGSHIPAIQASHCSALAIRAAALTAIRFAGMQEKQLQGQACYQLWFDAIKEAKRDVNGVPEEAVGSMTIRTVEGDPLWREGEITSA